MTRLNPYDDCLLDDYDAVLFDLDGTVNIGRTAIAGAVDTVRRVRERMPVRFVTNNASRLPKQITEHLTGLGFDVVTDEITTSAQAGAAMLAQHLTAGDAVLVVGTDGLADEVSFVGLQPVRAADGNTAGVIQGYSFHTAYRDLAEACFAIRAGAVWVACNMDLVGPTERGPQPGNGAMVTALQVTTGCKPLVAGKPERPLMDQAIRSANAQRPLVIGDRLDTDIAGANAIGADALFVLSGVSTPVDLLTAHEQLRPRYVSADLTGVFHCASETLITGQPGWSVEVADAELIVSRNASIPGDQITLLRALCAAWWSVGTGQINVRANDDVTGEALNSLGIQ